MAPDDVVSALVKAIDKHILHKHAFLKVVIHTAISLNEDIARKLNESGIHAVILCVDASRNMTMGSINETIKHLDRDLIYRSMVIVNIMKPFTITYHSISERVTHLVRVFKCQIVHMLMEVRQLRLRLRQDIINSPCCYRRMRRVSTWVL